MTEQPNDDGGRSRTRLDPEERRNQIIEAAIEAFDAKDPAEVSFEAVADAAGVSRSLVYRYFGDRGHLYAAAYLRAIEILDDHLRADLAAIDDDRERLTAAMRTYLDFARVRRAHWNVIVAASKARYEPVRDAVTERSSRVARRLGDESEGGLLVSGVMAMLDVAAEHTVEHGADTDRLAEMLSQIVWSGISSLEDG